jgi:hypothetical protein
MIDWPILLFRGAAVCVTVAGLGMIVYGASRAIFRTRESSWKSTEGVITLSVVEEDTSDESRTHRARVEYTYQVGHVTYIGDRIAPLQKLMETQWSAQRAVGKYGLGRHIGVYFDPRNPGQSVLEPGRQISTAIGFIAFGAVLCFFGWNMVANA